MNESWDSLPGNLITSRATWMKLVCPLKNYTTLVPQLLATKLLAQVLNLGSFNEGYWASTGHCVGALRIQGYLYSMENSQAANSEYLPKTHSC